MLIPQLNGTLSLDICTTEQLKALAPHKSVFDLNSPRTVSKNLSIPDTVISTISSWLHLPVTKIDLEKEAKMVALTDMRAPDAPDRRKHSRVPTVTQ